MEKTVRRDGRAWYISQGRCEGIPDPSEVFSLGKLSVFLISYNLIIRNDITTDLEMDPHNSKLT
jgi:hypothetical protein